MPVPEDLPEDSMQMFTALMQIGWLMPLIAIAEIIGGILFMLPKLRALGAVILAPVMLPCVHKYFFIFEIKKHESSKFYC